MTTYAEIVDGRIALWADYDGGRGKERCKSIPGHKPRWENPDGTFTTKGKEGAKFAFWSYPLAMQTASAIRREFPDVELGPELHAWGWEQRRQADELEKLRAGGESDLPRVREQAPVLWEAMQTRPFQIAGAAFIVKGKRVCLGDEMRLGKTYQAIAAMVESGCKTVLIACPKTATRSVWMRKINELAPTYMPFVAQGGRSQREQVMQAFLEMPYDRKVLIINKEMIRVKRRYECQIDGKPSFHIAPGRKGGCQYEHGHDHKNIYIPEYDFLFERTWDAIILDECHHALASEKNIQSKGITQIRMGAVRLKVADEGLKLGLSGTPFRAKLTKSWGVLNWMRPDVFSSFWRYVEELFVVTNSGYGGARVIGKLRSEEALQEVLRPFYLARTKADVAPWLPPVQHVPVILPMEDKQAKAYQDILEDARVELETGNINANGVLAQLTRLRQFACAYGRITSGDFYPAEPSNKLEWILQFAEEMIDVPDRKVVIASGFTKLVKLIADTLRKEGYATLTLTGESSAAQRDHAQDEFLNGKTRFIVINTFAGGEAIDLSSADDLILVDEPWNDDARQQVENRIQNLAKQQQVTVHRLLSEGTIDERMDDMNDEQREKLRRAKPEVLKELLS